jgi:hypothetical protein
MTPRRRLPPLRFAPRHVVVAAALLGVVANGAAAGAVPGVAPGTAAVPPVARPPTRAALAAAAALAAEFKRIDTNEDGRVSSSEHEVYARVVFDALDRDVDYKLTVAEIMAAPAKFLRHVSAGAGGFLGATELSTAEKIQRIDANHDGVVSRDEHADAARAKFRAMDGNSNGELTPEEFAAGG